MEKGTAQNPFTQADVDAIDRDSCGVRRMPSGFYGSGISFGDRCRFDDQCRFYRGCNFGDWCSFGQGCRFDERCSFGQNGRFGARSWLGDVCNFGEMCSFGVHTRFGTAQSFAEMCFFGDGCIFEGERVPLDWRRPYFAVDRIGAQRRKAYFFNFDGVIHVRAGCFFGDEPTFVEKLEADKDATKTRHYKLALELARDVLTTEA